MFRSGRGSIGDSVGNVMKQTCLPIDCGDPAEVLRNGARVGDPVVKDFIVTENPNRRQGGPNKIQAGGVLLWGRKSTSA